MDLFELLTNPSINAEQVWGVVKGVYLLGLVMYLVFAVVVVRQVGLMSRTLNGTVELPIKLVAKLHLAAAVVVVVVAVWAL